jgi:4-deoxy-L-threo-5-hexosulose-uronate ketol-isomerase
MDVRYSPNFQGFKNLDTTGLRNEFLVDKLFEPSKIYLLYSDVDRAIVGSAVPTDKGLKLEASKKEMSANYFAERREVGIINIGKEGTIVADGKEYDMKHKDSLYIGRGTKDIEFRSKDKNEPSQYYFVSYPAHKEFPTSHAKFSDAEPARLGSLKDSNHRTIYKYIHPNGIKSSQLVMGLTELEEGSVWNTMPVHTHQRRSEVNMYFGLEKNAVVFHFMGNPSETRHIVIRNRQAVISPSWSFHSGSGTQNYSFIWAMGGENQAFDDMDAVNMEELF